MRLSRLYLLVCALFVALPAWAQPSSVTVGQSFRATWTHNGTNTIGYRVYLDNQLVTEVPVSSLSGGGTGFNIPATAVTTRGAHVLAVSAYNADQESNRVTLDFTAKLPPPADPTNLNITLSVALNSDGTVSLRWESASALPR
jgi:hypothetical protein